MPPKFFIAGNKKGKTRKDVEDDAKKRFTGTGKRKGVEEKEDPRARKRRQMEEDEIDSSDSGGEDELEYSDDENRVSEASENEYEDTNDKKYRMAKELLEKLSKKQDHEHEEDVSGDEKDDVIGARLKREAAIQAGTLHRPLADRLEIEEEDEMAHKGHRFTPLSVALSPCKKFVVSSGKESHIVKYSIEEQKIVGVIKRVKSQPAEEQKAHYGHIYAVTVSPNGKFIVSGGYDCLIKVWNFHTLNHIRDLTGHLMPITCLRFRSGSTEMFSASRDRSVKLWDVDAMGLLDTMYGHQDAVYSLETLNKQRTITCGSQDRTLRMWKVEAESQLVFKGPADCVSMDCVAMLNEDHYISGAANGTIYLWSIFRKKPTASRQLAHGTRGEHGGPRWVVSVTAAPFTNLFASGSDDGQLRLWKVSEDYRKIFLIYEYEMFGFINDMHFSTDASLLVVAVGKEHKYGRWWVEEDAENKVVVLPLKYKAKQKEGDENENAEA